MFHHLSKSCLIFATYKLVFDLYTNLIEQFWVHSNFSPKINMFVYKNASKFSTETENNFGLYIILCALSTLYQLLLYTHFTALLSNCIG